MPKLELNKAIQCADGFKMSVHAHEGAYCTPRITGAERYTAVEVGYPSQEEPLLLQWADEPEQPTNTVYGWVPSQQVALVIAKHGGMVDGALPPGVPKLEAHSPYTGRHSER